MPFDVPGGTDLSIVPALAPGRVVSFGTEHRVAPGESLTALGARYGAPVAWVAAQNGLPPDARLQVGQRLTVRSVHVAPIGHQVRDGIVVNVPQRMAWLFSEGRVAGAWPVAVGRASWPTPLGPFTVRSREQDKTWYVPVSIQEEMRREGKPVLTQVPPGPDNPLGRHWLGLSLPGIGIHGTNAPASVYGFRSHGCIRMHPDDVAELFARTRVGDAGQIIYEPLLMALDGAGGVWFEANPDAYRLGGGSRATVQALLASLGLPEASLDWTRVDTMLENRDGQAREVDRDPNGEASR